MINKKVDLDSTKPVFTISFIAENLEVCQRTLRIYDEEGILKPFRSPKNRRLYSYDDLEKGRLIQYMTRDLGINLAGVKLIFSLLFELNIKQHNRLEYIANIALSLNISPEQQEQTHIKLSKRGRKKKEAV